MKEFLEALAISLAFVLGGYFLFGSLGKTQPETKTMDMSNMNMPSESSTSMEGMESMPGMSH
jgi:hypothetical protein